MPFIRTTTNVNLAVDQEKRLRTGTAELVRDILNKDPIRMMTAYEGNISSTRLFMAGMNRQRFLKYN